MRYFALFLFGAVLSLAADAPKEIKLDPEQRLAAEKARREYFQFAGQVADAQRRLQDMVAETNKKLTALGDKCKELKGDFDTDNLSCAEHVEAPKAEIPKVGDKK